MKTINASAHIEFAPNAEEILLHLERCGRTCYKSEDRIGVGTAEKFVRHIIRNGHETILEHASVTVRFIVDRGVSHELVRHRIASFSQESTRYCNYSKEGFGSEITVIQPPGLTPEQEQDWYISCDLAEATYFSMLEGGSTPQMARAVLPNSLKTEVIMTANLREWRHFFKLRALSTTGKPHPQMLEVTIPLLKEFQERIPVVFEDLQVE